MALHSSSKLSLLFALAACAACGDDDTPGFDTRTDTGDTSMDAGDVAPDVSDPDVSDPDVSDPDVSDPDASTDAGTDVGVDATDAGDTQPDVPDATVDVAPTEFFVTGTATTSGPTGTTWLDLVVEDAVVETIETATSGDFAFTTALEDGAAFSVVVTDQPFEGFCAPSPAEGAIDTANVSVTLDCVPAVEFRVSAVDWDRGEHDRSELFEDEDGIVVRRYWEVGDVGPDGVPFTADDSSTYRTMNRMLPQGNDIQSVRYVDLGDDALPWTPDDGLRDYTNTTYDEVGNRLTRISYDGAGDDGVWLTADDEISRNERYLHQYDEAGRVTCSVETWAGADNVFETEDDDVDDAYAWAYTELPAFDAYSRNRAQIEGPGDDGIYCTDDDVVGPWSTFGLLSDDGTRSWYWEGETTYEEYRTYEDSMDEVQVLWEAATPDVWGGPDVDTITSYRRYRALDDRTTHSVTATGPGPDAEWFTDDDLFTQASPLEVYEDGVLTHQVTYDSTTDVSLNGPDGLWGTADDVAATWQALYVGEDGTRCVAERTDPGADGLWDAADCGNDGDDAIAWVDWSRLAEDGLSRELCESTSAGTDGLWLTADDAMDGCSIEHRITDTVSVTQLITGFGPDSTPFTADDEAEYDRMFGVDAGGRIILSTNAIGPGLDGVWYTGDDDIGDYDTWSYDRSGNLLHRGDETTAGDDGLWFTEDDAPTDERWYEMSPFISFLLVS